MWANRRLNPRVEVELPAEYRIKPTDAPLPGTIANLSAGGAAIRTERQIPPRSLIHQFRFLLPTADGKPEPVEASAVLVHARPVRSGTGIGYLSGVHFLGFESSEYERLASFVRDHCGEPDDLSDRETAGNP